jgi:hypothetical protein
MMADNSLLYSLRKIDAELPYIPAASAFAKFHNEYSDKVVGGLTYAQSLRLMEKGELVIIGRGALREIIRQLEQAQ